MATDAQTGNTLRWGGREGGRYGGRSVGGGEMTDAVIGEFKFSKSLFFLFF